MLKCEESKPKKLNFEECSVNLKNELESVNPVATIVCGKEPIKYFNKYQIRKTFELPSITILFKGKKGINLMKTTLQIIRDTYIG